MPRPFSSYFQEPGNRRFKVMEGNKTLEQIYEFMATETSVKKMIDASENHRPALEPLIEAIERDFPFNDEFDLIRNCRYRQILGSMCRFILQPEGYYPVRSVKLKKGQYIQSATVYRMNKPEEDFE